MQKIYLLVGCPGVGKSWVTRQLASSFTPIEHDEYRDYEERYVPTLLRIARTGTKPVIANTPFGVSEIMAEIDRGGGVCVPIFIVDAEERVKARYEARDGKPIPSGHLTRQKTYMKRAHNLGAFMGNSDQVLKHLQSLL